MLEYCIFIGCDRLFEMAMNCSKNDSFVTEKRYTNRIHFMQRVPQKNNKPILNTPTHMHFIQHQAIKPISM